MNVFGAYKFVSFQTSGTLPARDGIMAGMGRLPLSGWSWVRRRRPAVCVCFIVPVVGKHTCLHAC
jgi:hypothetical protein